MLVSFIVQKLATLGKVVGTFLLNDSLHILPVLLLLTKPYLWNFSCLVGGAKYNRLKRGLLAIDHYT